MRGPSVKRHAPAPWGMPGCSSFRKGQKMKQGFLKLNRGDATEELMKQPNEFMLLCLIAYRARRTESFNVAGLEPGEALIGDYRTIGLTERKYRTAKKRLAEWGFSTFKPTSKGTIGKIINSSVWDINSDTSDEQNDRQATRKRRASDEQATTNKKEKKDKNEKKEKKTTLPGWVDCTTWKDFCEHRKKQRAPLTDRAQTIILNKLSELRDQGHVPQKVLEQSIERGWKSVFPLGSQNKEKGQKRYDNFDGKQYRDQGLDAEWLKR